MPSDDNEYRVRMALAAQAYDSGIVRLNQRNLSGYDHLVASRSGLFAVCPDGFSLVAHGQFYGITIGHNAIYAFEACGRPRVRERRGRIICLYHESDRISGAEVLASGLDNGCHQMDRIDDRLYLTDTYNQRLLSISLDGREIDALYPLPPPDHATGGGYAHINSLLAFDDAFYLLKHNNSLKTGIDSEIAVFDRKWALVETIALPGQACHNIGFLDDGSLISCGSLAGEIIGPDHPPIKICNRMTRGLSIGADQIVVGGSALLARETRDQAPGEVYFLDHEFRQFASITIPGPVMEIRRIDGLDRTLSAHLK